MVTEIIKLKDINKSFSGVPVLSDIDITFEKGKIYGLVGENGAGKTTLSRIILGELSPDSGTIFLDGKNKESLSIKETRQAGIRMVHQELKIIPQLSITENVFIGDEILKGPFVDMRAMNAKTQELLDRVGLNLNPRTKVGILNIASRQLVEICHAINTEVRFLILDEPTSSLSKQEIEKLFNIMRDLRDQGITIIFITHRLQEIIRITQEVVVMKDGCITTVMSVKEATEEKIVKEMVGRNYEDYYNRVRNVHGDEVLRVENFTGIPSKKAKTAFNPISVSFKLHEGEVLGLAGLVGAGRTELVKMIYGEYEREKNGRIFINNQEASINNPSDALNYSMAWITEDRKKDGLILKFSIKDNIAIQNISQLMHGMFVDNNKECNLADEFISKLNIKTIGRSQKTVYLSGGNQQKVLLAKWLASNPTIIIMDEPTKGVDVGAKAEIYKIINDLTSSGIGILLISSEMPELIGMSDRIIVISEGKITGEFLREEFDEEAIMSCVSGKILIR